MRLIAAIVLAFILPASAAQLMINVGAAANDGTGDPFRTAMIKVNTNFYYLFNTSSGSGRLTNFATVAAMSAANPASFDFAFTSGYYTANDGGGGIFFATNSIVSTNIGTRFVSAGATNSWERYREPGPVSVKWFGAKGDGIANDRVAIQAALTNGFSSVYFPKGTYLASGSMTPASGQLIFGDGDQSTITQTAITNSIFAQTNLSGVTFRGLRLVGLGDESINIHRRANGGIYLKDSTNIVISSCTFSNFSGTGVVFDSVKDSLISENRFDLAGWPSGVDPLVTTNNYQMADVWLLGNSQRNVIRDNLLASYGYFGVHLTTENAGELCAWNVITHNRFVGQRKYGVILYTASGSVERNTISENFISDVDGSSPGNDGTYSQGGGIYIQSAEDNKILNNTLSSIGFYTTNQSVPPGAITINSASRVEIAGNYITNSFVRPIALQGASDTNGVAVVRDNYITSSGRAPWEGGIVVLQRGRVKATGNVIRDTYQHGMYANTGSSDLEFNDNTIINPQGCGISISGSVTNSQFNRNKITVTNTATGTIWMTGTSLLFQIVGNNLAGGSATTSIVAAGDGLIAHNHIHGALTGISSSTTNEFENTFSAVGTAHSGTAKTTLIRQLHLKGDAEQFHITPPAETGYSIARLNNAAGARKLEMVYVGTGAASAYGIPAGGVGINAAGASGTITLSTFDLPRWVIKSDGVLEAPGTEVTAAIAAATGRLDISTLAGNGDIFLTTHGTGKVNLNSVTANTLLAADASKYLKSIALSGATFDGTTLTITPSAGGFTNTATAVLTYGATVTPDIDAIPNITRNCPRRVTLTITLTGNVTTFNVPTATPIHGDEVKLQAIQDGTGGRTIALAAGYRTGTDITSLTLSTTASKTDWATFTYTTNSATWDLVGFVRGF